MTLTRNKEQQLVMTSLYDALTYVDMDESFKVEDILEGVYKMPFEEIPSFSKLLVVKSLTHINEIVEDFQSHMSTWNFDRLNRLERAILIMSYTHKKYLDDKIDKSIVIDVAINLAKEYLDSDDYKFINAILDKVL